MSCRALMKVCGAVAALALAGAAQAQETTETTTTQTTTEGTIPPAESTTTTTTTTTTTPAEPAPVTTVVTPAPPPPVVPPPAPPVTEHHRHHNRVFSPNQVSLTTGAGVANYFGDSVPDGSIDPGAMWDARMTFGTRSVFALEAAYMGGVNDINLGGGKNGQLFSNGIDGDLRLQLPFRVQPYAFGGVGYNHLEVRNQGTGVANGFVGKDDQVTIPAGGGVTAYAGRHITIDARGTYRFIPDNGITIMPDRHLHQWIAQANVGYAF